MRARDTTASSLLNRPMLDQDLAEIVSNPWAHALRRLAAEYREQGLPLVNGELAYSNLLEGPAQMLTCHPYRLWEYASLFRALGESVEGRSFLDIGGAASPLPCFLAELGARGLTLERQPLLVCLSNHIAQVRGLDLRAVVADAAGGADEAGEFDFVTCVSVIEHIPGDERPRLLQNVARKLKPGGLLYLTFDYGTYVAQTKYRRHETLAETPDESLAELGPLCDSLEAAGFTFLENDPRQLPDDVLALKVAPRHGATVQRMRLNRRPFDAETPWPEVARYLARRVLGFGRRPPTRYARHNFFRLFLTRANGR